MTETVHINTPEQLDAFIKSLSAETVRQGANGFVDLGKVSDDAGLVKKGGACERCGEDEFSMSVWRPIETAPKDGTQIILYPCFGIPSDPQAGNWYEGKRLKCWKSTWGNMNFPVQPTHWMPFPEPPKDKS
jgi:hypothetical protein